MADNLDIYMCLGSSANTEVAGAVFGKAGFGFRAFDDLDQLITAAHTNGVGILLLEELCLRQGHDRLVEFLDDQPQWSEIPVVMVTAAPFSAIGQSLLRQVGDITMLEKPIAGVALTSHLRAALQSRSRQYELRDLLMNLADLNKNLEREVENRTAEANRRRRELERTNDDLRQFASVISHDLREPLLVISRYLNLLEKQYEAVLDAGGRKYIHKTLENTNRMQTMISSILKYSRSDGGILNMEEVAVGEVVDQACSNLSVTIDKNKATITRDELPTVYADRVQLLQLFQNLIGNGIKYSHLESPRIHISAEEHEEEVQFGVSDNGIGIDFEQYQKIFRIFERADAGAKYPGAGVGLAVCKRIIERHGGIIWVESQLWKGSTFYFTLPWKSEATVGSNT